MTPGSASWSTLRVDASRRRRGFLREMIGPTPRMLGGGWTIAGAVARCKPIPDPIVAVVSSRKRAVHSPGATAAQRALESYKAERESCRAIYSTQHIRSSTCGETAEDRERSRRDRHRAKLALPERLVERKGLKQHAHTSQTTATRYMVRKGPSQKRLSRVNAWALKLPQRRCRGGGGGVRRCPASRWQRHRR